MSESQPRTGVMSLDMLDAKIAQCEAADRQRRLEREKQKAATVSNVGNLALNRRYSSDEVHPTNPRITMGSD